VDFNLTPAQEAFREEIREFLRSELAAAPGRVREDGWVVGFSRAFSEKLGKRRPRRARRALRARLHDPGWDEQYLEEYHRASRARVARRLKGTA